MAPVPLRYDLVANSDFTTIFSIGTLNIENKINYPSNKNTLQC